MAYRKEFVEALKAHRISVLERLDAEGVKFDYWDFRKAIELGNLDAILLMLDQGYDVSETANRMPWPWTRYVNIAAVHGQLDIVRWFVMDMGHRPDDNTLVSAAMSGNLELVQWLYKECGCALNKDVHANAILCGNWQVVHWLVEEGCPLNEHLLDFLTLFE